MIKRNHTKLKYMLVKKNLRKHTKVISGLYQLIRSLI